MKCRSCGQTNQLENKFCGFCGTSMQAERRTEERRIIAWEPQQCRSCGKTTLPRTGSAGYAEQSCKADRRRAERRTIAAEKRWSPQRASGNSCESRRTPS